METFKAIVLPLAVVLLAVAVVVPVPRGATARWVLAGAAVVLAFIALFVAADAVS
jgi:hypothetical protein